jgi:hypothetical protein
VSKATAAARKATGDAQNTHQVEVNSFVERHLLSPVIKSPLSLSDLRTVLLQKLMDAPVIEPHRRLEIITEPCKSDLSWFGGCVGQELDFVAFG